MDRSARRRLGRALVVGAVVAAIGVSASTGATASAPVERGEVAKIKIKERDGVPKFRGPKATVVGAQIQVINKTDPGAIGPHTFSIVKRSELPKGERERVKCGRNNNRKLVCKDIGEAHDMTGLTANIHDVDFGTAEVWDAKFTGGDDVEGDTWFTDTQEEDESRAAPGSPTKLWYMCIIHPRMQRSITIESLG